MAAPDFRSAAPRLMPTPKSATVPQLICGTASFQVMKPIFGSIMSMIPAMVTVVVSKGCSFFSVTQKKSRTSEMQRSFFSARVIGPISFSI